MKKELEKNLPQTRPNMIQALLDTRVMTWRLAAIKNDVTESGILRAWRRYHSKAGKTQ